MKRRQKLPEQVALVLDEKFVNLLKYHQLFAVELAKKQTNPLHLKSLIGEVSDIEAILMERLLWLFRSQFPRTKFNYGEVRRFKELPDKMPKRLQHAFNRYQTEQGHDP